MKLNYILLILALTLGKLSAQTPSLAQYLEVCPFLGEAEKQALLIAQEHQPQGLDAVFSTTTSSLSVCDIRLYPMVNGTPLIGVVERITAPGLDSRLSFYTPDWVLIAPKSLITFPERERLLQALSDNNSPEAQRLRELIYPLHYDIQWGQGGSLIISPSLHFSEEDNANDALKALAATLPKWRFEWRNYRFEEEKVS